MSLNDFLSLVTELLFVLVAGLTLLEWVRRREQTQLDIALVFVSLAITIILQDIQDVAGLQLSWLSMVGLLAFIAHPYFLLRVADYFRPVSPLIRRGALLGLGLSWLALVSAAVINLRLWLAGAALLIVVYFITVEAYATLIFVQGALTTAGITRRRLGLASAGSGLLAAIILFLVLTVVLPAPVRPLITPLFQVLAAFSGLSYYLGFATPRWLKRIWQNSELHRFLHESDNGVVSDRLAMFEKLRSAAVRAVGGLTTVVAQWEPTEQHLKLINESSLAAVPWESDTGALGQAWRAGQARVARAPADLGAESAEWAKQMGARALLVVPVISPSRAWGLLIIALRYQPLFAQDDLDVLHLLARETALNLDYTALIEELRVANQSLEERVAERTAEVTEINQTLQADIAERQRTEAALRASEERLRTTMDSMLEGGQIIDFDWRYVYVNDASAAQGRQPKEALLGQTMMEMYPGIETTDMFSALRQSMAQRIPQRLENEFLFPDGSKGWFDLNLQPVPEGVFILSHDITQRKRAEQEIEHQLKRIRALRTIDLAIMSSTDIALSLKITLEQVIMHLGVDAAAVFLLSEHTHILEYAAGRGFRTKTKERTRLRLGQGYLGRAALERRAIHIPRLADEEPDFTHTTLVRDEAFQAYFAAPLIAKGRVVGVLEVFHRSPLDPDSGWLEFLETLAGQTAIAVDSVSLFNDLQRANIQLTMAYDDTIEGWSRALDLRDKETEGHSQRVTEMTLQMAQAIGIAEDELVQIRRGALLHDIGKMGIPDGILLKPGKLTDEEWVIMRQHPTFAHNMLSPIIYLRPALDIPYCHHEKWDGTGYPRGLKGEQIPLAARLFAVVDVWDALRSDRPYRQGWPEEKVLAHIQSLSGTHFDPHAVEIFLKVSSS